ncbi:MucB/RseB C-terminal domain-containing protein [Zooshikella harenae]|uniref:MucB/RseB C-terminal domain-containing protein n=1 Tax=Zooshikella harenae TaxID=2827238 RepID=A0ABS5Z6L9_9GAMM|nr:MucB/RseB C-terminal domain-containing protein [Zooshikella harenae]MBU2709700.1 MucB/RseB C-terminal domain-containing protein [Zooshikella harenae]
MQVRFGLRLAILAMVMLAGNVSAAANEDRTALDWLQAMVNATQQLNYEGQFVYEHSRGLTTMSIAHAYQDGQVRERLVYLDGPHREVIRYGRKVMCVTPKNEVIRFDHQGSPIPFSQAFQKNLSKIASLYSLQQDGHDRVANRSAVVINVLPNDQHRYGYRLWLDQDTALLLKSVLLDNKGKLLERLQFTSLQTGKPIAEERLVSSLSDENTVEQIISTQSVNEQSKTQQSWRVSWVPDGFELSRHDERKHSGYGMTVASLMFSDGLSAFSVFVEQGDERSAAQQALSRRGAMTAISRMLKYKKGIFLVTVVGEVPEKTAEKIAVSVQSALNKP